MPTIFARAREDLSPAKIGRNIAMAVAPGPLDSSPLSSQRKTAPCARPARRKDDVFRQVSWLAGHNPSPPFQALAHKGQWHTEEGLAADSCGGSSGFASPPKRRIAPDSLFWPITAIGAPER